MIEVLNFTFYLNTTWKKHIFEKINENVEY